MSSTSSHSLTPERLRASFQAAVYARAQLLSPISTSTNSSPSTPELRAAKIRAQFKTEICSRVPSNDSTQGRLRTASDYDADGEDSGPSIHEESRRTSFVVEVHRRIGHGVPVRPRRVWTPTWSFRSGERPNGSEKALEPNWENLPGRNSSRHGSRNHTSSGLNKSNHTSPDHTSPDHTSPDHTSPDHTSSDYTSSDHTFCYQDESDHTFWNHDYSDRTSWNLYWNGGERQQGQDGATLSQTGPEKDRRWQEADEVRTMPDGTLQAWWDREDGMFSKWDSIDGVQRDWQV